MHAPFRGLHTVDRVTTSNDEYSISLYWSPERFRIDYPDGRGPFERDPADPTELYTALSVFCRADGRREGLSGPRPLGARLSLPMHPAAPAVYSVLHPMYWVLGLTGREFERVPIVVDLAGVAPFDAELVRRRIAYGRPRPDIEIDLPGAAVLGGFIAGSPMRLAVTGDSVDIELWFAGAADLVGPAQQMSFALLRSTTSASCTTPVGGWRSPTRKPSAGSAGQPSRDTPTPSTPSAQCIAPAGAWHSPRRKLPGGSD